MDDTTLSAVWTGFGTGRSAFLSVAQSLLIGGNVASGLKMQQPLTRPGSFLVPPRKAARYSSFRKYPRDGIGLCCD
jgi:hypothetical protein